MGNKRWTKLIALLCVCSLMLSGFSGSVLATDSGSAEETLVSESESDAESETAAEEAESESEPAAESASEESADEESGEAASEESEEEETGETGSEEPAAESEEEDPAEDAESDSDTDTDSESEDAADSSSETEAAAEETESGEEVIYGLNEDGTTFVYEQTSDGVVCEEDGLELASSTKIVNFRADADGVAVTGITEYTEYSTGNSGYTNGLYGADAAYLGTVTQNGTTYVKFMLSGVVGLVEASEVQVVNLSSVSSYSYYAVNSSGYLVHHVTYDLTGTSYACNSVVGPCPSYLSSNVKYYSYDGHYFYKSYTQMLSDYQSGIRTHAVNADDPYYNYFQYLPLRGTSSYSASDLDTLINSKISSTSSKMYDLGSVFYSNQETYGVNALLMIAVAANESGWGSSTIAQSKNNLFGINAADSNTGNATTFYSTSYCIQTFAETYMSKRYLNPNYTYYNGGYLGDKASGINVKYASDPYWGEKAAAIAWTLDDLGGEADQYAYTIGIKDTIATSHTDVSVLASASSSASVLYTTGNVSNYAFLVLGESGKYYQVQSDAVLNSSGTAVDTSTGEYSSSMTGYVSQSSVTIVSGDTTAGSSSSVTTSSASSGIAYCVYLDTEVWEDYCWNGDTAGTVGASVGTQAIQITLEDMDYSGSVQYRTYLQTYGWQSWVSDGTQSGTTTQSKRMEAIQIELTGEIAEYYDIYYRVHVQTYGWLDWAKNGETAGTTGYAKRLEAIQIVLVEKDGDAPGDTDTPSIQSLITYRMHVQSTGWQSSVTEGQTSGTVGSSLRAEAIQISLVAPEYSGSIQYRVHLQSTGWQSWISEGLTAGTTGQARRMEAIQIELTGEMAEHYDIYYRAHVQTYGWLDWAKNGETAGTVGYSKRLEAIQIVLVEKGEAAPGSTSTPSITK